ncbi:MAG: Gfo/Idh/MocA family oxidoreductase [Planctomycetota bacterium]
MNLNEKLRIAVIGYGRIGRFHSQHVMELADIDDSCELVAIVEPDDRRLQTAPNDIATFSSVPELLEAGIADACVICSATHTHQSVAEELVQSGLRVMMEKPMTDTLESDRQFTEQLNADWPNSVMLAFQRRYDPPLQFARELLQQKRLGEPFKIISILEDSAPPPDGYESPGLLIDMSVHNIDEIIWLLGSTPTGVVSVGSRVYNHKISTVEEDYDDATIHLQFDRDLTGRIEVSRLHVPGYHVETVVYCEQGVIRVGSFQPDPLLVHVDVLKRGELVERREFRMRDYRSTFPDLKIPEFIERFGAAYQSELADFIEKCRTGKPFAVDQNDGLRAGQIAAAANRAAQSSGFQSID